MIKNYIFDFGNVLARFDTKALTSAVVTDEQEAATIEKVVFDRLYWDKLDDGTITDEQVKTAVCQRLPQALHEKAYKVYDNWVENLIPIHKMIAIVKQLKAKEAKLYLLSNISIGFAEKYPSVAWIKDLFDLFDGLVFSGPIHMTKPHADIFQYLLDKYNLNAQECLFIDDSKLNTDGANAVGIATHLFNGNMEALKTKIALL